MCYVSGRRRGTTSDRGAPATVATDHRTLRGQTMSQLFSTELLPASDRVDAWQWNAKQICGDCRVRFPKVAFHGTIDAREVGGLRLTRFTSSPLAFSKWPGDWLTPDNRFCIVITQIAGARHYQQAGQSVL